MLAVLFRLVLLAAGVGFGQMAIDSIARAEDMGIVQLLLAFVFLVAGTAGIVVPLLEARVGGEVTDHG